LLRIDQFFPASSLDFRVPAILLPFQDGFASRRTDPKITENIAFEKRDFVNLQIINRTDQLRFNRCWMVTVSHGNGYDDVESGRK